MMLDDESLLSAYLDDELGPSDRQRVELALRDDPGLVRKVAELRRVRDLVAGLPRPSAPDDLALRVVVRIDQKRHYRTLLIATGSLAVAASLFVHVALPYLERSQRSTIVTDWGTPPEWPGLGSPVDSPTDDVELAQAAPELAGPPREAAVEVGTRNFLAALERPQVERFLVPVRDLDPATIETIEHDVKDTVRQRPAYYRVDLASLPAEAGPGGPAVVFALEATELELSALVARLSSCPALAGKISSEPAAPPLLTAVRGVSGVQAAEGVQGAIISRIDPRLVDRFALLEARGAGRSTVPLPVPDGDPDDLPDGKKLSTVLIWLAAGPRGD